MLNTNLEYFYETNQIRANQSIENTFAEYIREIITEDIFSLDTSKSQEEAFGIYEYIQDVIISIPPEIQEYYIHKLGADWANKI